MTDKYGPNTAQVEAYLALLPTLTDKQWVAARVAAWAAAWVAAWAAAGDASWDASRAASRAAAWAAARAAAWDAAWDAAGDAAWAASRAATALVVRDLISDENFDILTAPMRAAGIDFETLGAAS